MISESIGCNKGVSQHSIGHECLESAVFTKDISLHESVGSGGAVNIVSSEDEQERYIADFKAETQCQEQYIADFWCSERSRH